MTDALPAFDVSVLVRTLLRPTLLEAVRSIFRQAFAGRVQILLGIDAAPDAANVLAALRAECPRDMTIDILDLGYPTSARRGGLYGCREGGALPVLLAYAARARHCLFLDDDNWAAPDHLQALRDAVESLDWAFTLRWYVAPGGVEPLCLDEWESVGPGRGAYARRGGGFVDLNCLMFDKLACHFAIPWLAHAMPNGTGHDRLFFNALRQHHSVGWTGRPTLYYRMNPTDRVHPHRLAWLASRGIHLAAQPV